MTREEAIAYFTPHALTKGSVMLDPEKMRDAVATLRDAIAEAARYKARLELDHCFDFDGNAVPWPEGMTPIDGIACRDETIKGQDERIEGLVQDRTTLLAKFEDMARPSAIILACGEMTAQERRTARAVANWYLATARTLFSQSSEVE